MAVGSKQEFVQVLKASQLFDSEELVEILNKHSTDDPKLLAGKLAQEGTLTSWQAKMIYAGYPKLKLGNYVLLDRISRDDLGDRFTATHKSLDRQVEIQVLPKRISDEPQLQNFFISNIGLVSELDHPHITHIHDVDRAGGQFFLVDEAKKGVALDTVELTADGVLLCCNQILQGLAYAHSQGVVHGEVSLENIMYGGNRHFKIRGISLSLVRRKLAGNDDPTARDDHIALASLLEQRFRSLDSKQREGYDWLGNLLKQLQENPIAEYPRVLTATQQRIDAWGETQPAITLDELSDRPAAELLNLTEPTGSSGTPEKNPASKPSTKPEPPTSAHEESGQTDGRRTPLLVAGIVIGGLLLVMGGLYAAGIFSGEKAATKNDDPQTTRPTSTLNPQPDQKPSVKNPETLPKPSNDKDDQLDKQPNPDDDPQLPEDDTSKSEDPAPEEAKPGATDENPKPNDPVKDQGDTNPDSMANNSDNQEDEESTEEPADPIPFEQMPSIVDLPATEVKDRFTIGPIGELDDLTSLEIVTDPSLFSNGKGSFAIKDVNETTWEVQLLNKPDGMGDSVARIEVADQSLQFTWLEEVSKKSKANAIRNGILRLRAGDSAKDIVLRKPIPLDVKLSSDAYSSKITTDAIWLPQASSIRIEVQKPAAPWPTKLYLNNGDEFPETFVFDEARNPLIVLFSSDNTKQFVSVVFTPKINRKLSFEVGVFARGKNTDPVQYKSAKSADETIELLKKARENQSLIREQAQVALDRARQIRNGTIGKREDDVNAARKAFKEIDGNIEIAEQIRDQLSGLHDAPIQLTVFYEIDGQRIVLAESNPPANQ